MKRRKANMTPVEIFQRREFGVFRLVLLLDGDGRVEGLFDHADDVAIPDFGMINKAQDRIRCGPKDL